MNVALTLSRSRDAAIISVLGIVLLIAVLFSLTVGAVSIPIADVLIILLKRVGMYSSTEVDGMHKVVMSTIRLPRILLTLLIGGALGVSGAALQGLFRNPLVEPGIIGVSGGSASAVVLVIVFGRIIAIAHGRMGVRSAAACGSFCRWPCRYVRGAASEQPGGSYQHSAFLYWLA